MTASPLDLILHDGVATVTLTRADPLNALSADLAGALLGALRTVADDSAVRAVVLTGQGRGFCVGQDLREHAAALDADPTGRRAIATVPENLNPLVLALTQMPKPTIAAVNGIAAGAGAALSFACDIRLAAESASFAMAFSGIGLSSDTGAAWTLPRLVGGGRALAMLLLGERVAAHEALAMGLVSAVVPDDSLAPAAAEIAARLAAGPTLAYAAIREAVLFGATAPLPATLAKEAEIQFRIGATQDHQNAVRAFTAKQPPTFEGR